MTAAQDGALVPDQWREAFETCRMDWRYLMDVLVTLRDEWTSTSHPKDAKTRDFGRGVAYGLSLVVAEMQRLDELTLPPSLTSAKDDEGVAS